MVEGIMTPCYFKDFYKLFPKKFCLFKISNYLCTRKRQKRPKEVR